MILEETHEVHLKEIRKNPIATHLRFEGYYRLLNAKITRFIKINIAKPLNKAKIIGITI
jgi:hypothetical protein